MIRWNASPEILSLGPVHLRWYGLLFASSFLVGASIFDRLNLRTKVVTDSGKLFKYVVIGTIVGARLGHCFFYDPAYYFAHPLEIPMVWQGGLASHGGVLGVISAVWLYCRKFPQDRLVPALDLMVIPTVLAACFIRLGNLMNSEILGRPTDLPWAFVFETVDPTPRHPAQLYEAIAYFGIFLVIHRWYSRRAIDAKAGPVFGFVLITVFGARFGLEFLKEYQSAFEAGLPLDMGQLLSIPMILVGILFMWRPPGQPALSKRTA